MNRPECYKDKKKWRETCKRQTKKYYDKTAIYKGKPRWSDEDTQKVLEHKITDMELSYQIKRSAKAIQVHRARMRKKDEKMKENRTMNDTLASQKQREFCENNNIPHFASTTCWCCGNNIYKDIPVSQDCTSYGHSVEYAENNHVTDCPHCHRSFCD